MMIFGVLFWVVLLVVGIFALRGFQVSPPPGAWQDHEVGPEEILKARYARGEITREEFEQMWHDLRQA